MSWKKILSRPIVRSVSAVAALLGMQQIATQVFDGHVEKFALVNSAYGYGGGPYYRLVDVETITQKNMTLADTSYLRSGGVLPVVKELAIPPSGKLELLLLNGDFKKNGDKITAATAGSCTFEANPVQDAVIKIAPGNLKVTSVFAFGWSGGWDPYQPITWEFTDGEHKNTKFKLTCPARVDLKKLLASHFSFPVGLSVQPTSKSGH
jgi:hypothetical protein